MYNKMFSNSNRPRQSLHVYTMLHEPRVREFRVWRVIIELHLASTESRFILRTAGYRSQAMQLSLWLNGLTAISFALMHGSMYAMARMKN